MTQEIYTSVKPGALRGERLRQVNREVGVEFEMLLVCNERGDGIRFVKKGNIQTKTSYSV